MSRSVVHVVRHGQVHNPEGVLYERLPGYRLSELGERMAQRLGEHFADANIVWLASSPLERTRQTMAPIAAAHPQLEVHLDDRLIESANHAFAGKSFGPHYGLLLRPSSLWALRNPLRPSWGEPYLEIAKRMRAAIEDAAAHAVGGEAVLTSHELPIWMARLSAEGRTLVHDPRKRQARLASVTTFTFEDGALTGIGYAEPCADLVPPKKKRFRPGA